MEKPYWQGLNPKVLGNFGVYSVWRLDREILERRAKTLKNDGVTSTWKNPRPERFKKKNVKSFIESNLLNLACYIFQG